MTSRLMLLLCALAASCAHPPAARDGMRVAIHPRTCEDRPDPSIGVERIGVLVPLSGRYRQYGERALTAIHIAVDGAGVELIVRDTGGDAARTRAAVAHLASRRVRAIIGPIASGPALAAARAAEEQCVPLVALSHRADLPNVGPWIFRTAVTAAAQARALAEVAFRDLGMRRFALLFPQNGYGQEFTLAFWDEVERRHGEIRGVEWYDPSATNFRVPVHKLVGLYVDEAPLWPVIDFDAIVLPDAPVRLGMIAPTLSFADVVLTQDKRQVERIRKSLEVDHLESVRLLGGSTWNDPQLLDYCTHDCEWAVFVDGFFADSPEVQVRDFVSAFRDARDTDPELLDAVAFDTAELLGLLTRRRAAGRAELRADLLQRTHDGLTGRFHFDAAGEIDRALRALTVKDRAIRPFCP